MTSLFAAMNNNATQITSAAGWLALLQEPDVTLQSHALTKLLECVEYSWHEVAESLPDLESISENTMLPDATRHTAAAVASHVFFHLDEPQQALRLALEAGDFDVSVNDTYSKRLITAALDSYIAFRRGEDEEDHFHSSTEIPALPIGPLKALVHKLLISSCEKGHAADALGIALEAREIDQVHFILTRFPYLCSMALESPMTSKAFRTKVFQSVAECLPMDQIMLRVLVHQRLNQPEPVSKVLFQLISGTDDQALLGYQVCFDLIDSGDQAFINAVACHIPLFSESNLRWKQAERILLGGFDSELALSFMHKNSHADRLIMEQLKKALEERGSGGRNSILHNAAVVTHSYLYAGTTNDSFLRDYLDWMKKASNW
jgi:26S proteasome regulatory subunit N2